MRIRKATVGEGFASNQLHLRHGRGHAPGHLRFEVPNLLHMYCHPLRFPERFLELYRALTTRRTPDVRAR